MEQQYGSSQQKRTLKKQTNDEKKSDQTGNGVPCMGLGLMDREWNPSVASILTQGWLGGSYCSTFISMCLGRSLARVWDDPGGYRV